MSFRYHMELISEDKDSSVRYKYYVTSVFTASISNTNSASDSERTRFHLPDSTCLGRPIYRQPWK